MESENTMNTITPPPAPRVNARLLLLAAVWAGAILLANPKAPADADVTAPVAQQMAIEVVPSAAMTDMLDGHGTRLVANVRVRQHAGAAPTVSIEVGAEGNPNARPTHLIAKR